MCTYEVVIVQSAGHAGSSVNGVSRCSHRVCEPPHLQRSLGGGISSEDMLVAKDNSVLCLHAQAMEHADSTLLQSLLSPSGSAEFDELLCVDFFVGTGEEGSSTGNQSRGLISDTLAGGSTSVDIHDWAAAAPGHAGLWEQGQPGDYLQLHSSSGGSGKGAGQRQPLPTTPNRQRKQAYSKISNFPAHNCQELLRFSGADLMASVALDYGTVQGCASAALSVEPQFASLSPQLLAVHPVGAATALPQCHTPPQLAAQLPTAAAVSAGTPGTNMVLTAEGSGGSADWQLGADAQTADSGSLQPPGGRGGQQVTMRRRVGPDTSSPEPQISLELAVLSRLHQRKQQQNRRNQAECRARKKVLPAVMPLTVLSPECGASSCAAHSAARCWTALCHDD